MARSNDALNLFVGVAVAAFVVGAIPMFGLWGWSELAYAAGRPRPPLYTGFAFYSVMALVAFVGWSVGGLAVGGPLWLLLKRARAFGRVELVVCGAVFAPAVLTAFFMLGDEWARARLTSLEPWAAVLPRVLIWGGWGALFGLIVGLVALRRPRPA